MPDFFRLQVVGLLVIDGVDLLQADELLDLDLPRRRLGWHLREVLVVDRHVTAGRDLVAFDDLDSAETRRPLRRKSASA